MSRRRTATRWAIQHFQTAAVVAVGPCCPREEVAGAQHCVAACQSWALMWPQEEVGAQHGCPAAQVGARGTLTGEGAVVVQRVFQAEEEARSYAAQRSAGQPMRYKRTFTAGGCGGAAVGAEFMLGALCWISESMLVPYWLITNSLAKLSLPMVIKHNANHEAWRHTLRRPSGSCQCQPGGTARPIQPAIAVEAALRLLACRSPNDRRAFEGEGASKRTRDGTWKLVGLEILNSRFLFLSLDFFLSSFFAAGAGVWVGLPGLAYVTTLMGVTLTAGEGAGEGAGGARFSEIDVLGNMSTYTSLVFDVRDGRGCNSIGAFALVDVAADLLGNRKQLVDEGLAVLDVDEPDPGTVFLLGS